LQIKHLRRTFDANLSGFLRLAAKSPKRLFNAVSIAFAPYLGLQNLCDTQCFYHSKRLVSLFFSSSKSFV
jgi:hypothetical protein